MHFQTIFVAVLIATALMVSALIINSQRPAIETNQPSAAHVTATGKCAACHRNAASAVVHEYEMSRHAAQGIICLDCHRPAEGQETMDHNGFTISTTDTLALRSARHRASPGNLGYDFVPADAAIPRLLRLHGS